MQSLNSEIEGEAILIFLTRFALLARYRRAGLASAEDLYRRRVTRILVEEFPTYFAIVTQVRRDSELLGEVGGVINSMVEPRVEAVVPRGAFRKNVRLSLQVTV